MGIQSKKILVVQPNSDFAKSHFSFAINLVYVLLEAGHQVHLLVPLIDESEKLDPKLESRLTVFYFMASEELRKAEEEHRKKGPPIGPAVGPFSTPHSAQIVDGNSQANGQNVNGLGPLENGGQCGGKDGQGMLQNGGMPPNGPMSNGGGHGGHHPLQGQRRPMPIFAKLYLKIASDTEFMAKLAAENYDIGLAESFMTNEWALAIFHLLRIPRTIVTSAMAPLPEFYYYLGMLGRMQRAEVPALRGTKIGDHLEENREARRKEMWQSFLDGVVKHSTDCIEIDIAFQDLADHQFGICPFSRMSQLFGQVDAYLVNSQPEIDWPSTAKAILSTPNNKIHYVGGMNAQRARQSQNGNSTLDEKILRLAVGKPKGMVLFSLGTVLDTNKRLTQEQFEAILEAMGQFPEHLFIWKLTEGDPRIGQINKEMREKADGEGNVYAADWVDQPAILAHPTTVGFVSHCGMNSALEAAWNGVPFVCLPCMGDQFYNSEALAGRGLAKVVDFFSTTETPFNGQVLAKALGKILEGNSKNALEGMRELGEKMRKKNVPEDILTAVIGE